MAELPVGQSERNFHKPLFPILGYVLTQPERPFKMGVL
jgi:hypothetical protein